MGILVFIGVLHEHTHHAMKVDVHGYVLQFCRENPDTCKSFIREWIMTNHESEAWCANLYDMIERLRYRLENLENNHTMLLQEIQNLKEK